MAYQAIYKCRLCGGKIIGCETPKRAVAHTAAKCLIDGYNEIDESRLHFGAMRGLKLHKCADDSIGIADFQGFKAVEE